MTLLETNVEVIDGHRLRLARLGSGPSLVCLHGYPENLHLFGRLARRLADRFEVIAFDWPGMGQSDAWGGGAAPEQMAKRLIAIFDHLEIERAHLFGTDMGGQPALVAAARYPDRVERLVVSNSLVLGDEKTSWEIALLRKYKFNLFVIRNLPRTVFRRARRTFLPPGVRLDSALRDDFWQHFRRPEVRHFISRMCAGYQGALPRLPRYYAAIDCPTLILWGGRDKHFPPSQAERLDDLIAHAAIEVLPDAWHWMLWHAADDVADRVRRFLSV